MTWGREDEEAGKGEVIVRQILSILMFRYVNTLDLQHWDKPAWRQILQRDSVCSTEDTVILWSECGAKEPLQL